MWADFYGVDSNSRDDRIDDLMELVDIKVGGVIFSIETEEPSLEDVFITTEVDEDARA